MFVTNVEMPLFSKSIVRMVETHKHSRQLKLEMAQLLDHKSLTALASMLKPKDDGDESDEDNSNVNNYFFIIYIFEVFRVNQTII